MPISTLSTTDAPPLHSRTDLDLRTLFRGAATSTWVVTGTGPTGPVGFTAISIMSVSLDPPLVSFNIAKTSGSLGPIARSLRAAVHLLSADQRAIAERFARDRSRRFVDDGVWSLDPHGLPVLHDVAARMVIDIINLVDAGDSFIAVGAVRDARTNTTAPLIYHAGDYQPATALGVTDAADTMHTHTIDPTTTHPTSIGA